MATITDPARELTELFEQLAPPSNEPGAVYVGRIIGIEPWSAEFHEVIASIINRLELLRTIIRSLGMDHDIQEQVIANVDGLQTAFDGASLIQAWNQRACIHFMTTTNIAAIKSLSHSVRSKISYPKLTDEEISEIVELTDTLDEWLRGRQVSEHDFIRQAIIDGIRLFKFRLQHLRWLGWGYTAQSLRDVVGAYLALERGTTTVANPDAELVLKKVASWIKQVSEATGIVRENLDNAGLMLKVYGAYSLAVSGQATVHGLIEKLSG